MAQTVTLDLRGHEFKCHNGHRAYFKTIIRLWVYLEGSRQLIGKVEDSLIGMNTLLKESAGEGGWHGPTSNTEAGKTWGEGERERERTRIQHEI